MRHKEALYYLSLLLVPPTAAFIANPVHASGYAVKEVSSSLLGMAFASAATSQADISAMHFNPAIIGQFKGTNAYFAGSAIMVDAEAKNVNGTITDAPPAGTAPTSTNGTSDLSPFAAVPALFASHQFKQNLVAAIGITAPWGLVTEYDENWGGAYQAVKSEAMSINVNPVLAYNRGPLTVAIGIQFQYLDAELTNKVQTGGGANANFNTDPIAILKGDDTAFGYSLGLMYNISEQTRVGLGFQSKISQTLKGDLTFNDGRAGALNLGGNQILAGDAHASITTPEKVNFGISHKVSNQLELSADIQWTNWDRFEELRAYVQGPAGSTVTEENWKSSFMYMIGATYKYSTHWTFRGGVALDETPVPDEFRRTPRIPDQDRTWLSLGTTYSFSDTLNIDAGFTYLLFGKVTMDHNSSGADIYSKGNLEAEFEGSGTLFAIGLNKQF